MTDPRQTRTNAADSAPGVDDGRKSSTPAPHWNSKPGGRRGVFLAVIVVVALLVVIFGARLLGPSPTREELKAGNPTPAETTNPAAQ